MQLRHNTLDKDVKLRKDYEKELSRKGLTKKEILKKVQERFAQKVWTTRREHNRNIGYMFLWPGCAV